ncbi:hypothetical protein E2320_014343 [Naja naja]|nr:hypothetical protein E2320_014343 [Naja naja]
MKMATGQPEGREDLSILPVEQLLGFSEDDPAQDLLPRYGQKHENYQELNFMLFQSEERMLGIQRVLQKSTKNCLKNGRKKSSPSDHNEVLRLPTQQLQQRVGSEKYFGDDKKEREICF